MEVEMPEEVGKIEKPPVERFEPKRKLFLVPLIFSGKDAPAEYVEKFEHYWDQAREHVGNLEMKLGKINKIYHELISIPGEDGMKVIQKMNDKSYQIASSKYENGAELLAIEDKDLMEESMDWERCLAIGLMSQEVARKVAEFYIQASRKRYEHMAKTIDETLKDREAGILFIREGHWVQFPKDVEVFSVYPPAFDEIQRWLREPSE
jgi:hypothetical protein